MHTLGQTRSRRRPDHVLLTPDTFVRAPLPGMKRCTAIIHAAPALGAAFSEYTAEFQGGGELGAAHHQRFLYVLEGTITLEADSKTASLGPRGYAFLPEGLSHRITAARDSRAVVIEKAYSRDQSVGMPDVVVSSEDNVASRPLEEDTDLQVRCLLPEEPSFDFAVNTMIYQPGAALGMVEMHVMEHGLVMLEGGGIYRLGDSWYGVKAGDFIWMAPWCPQWFGAIGKAPAKYLIYKDWNRHPLSARAQ
ncbi:MAG: (S)-ureidoglycine aminohydrolase [Acidobacteria bacterium]|nr:(S)-ureidoglycine aminohydrolase [Acidobacteriota bacterium]